MMEEKLTIKEAVQSIADKKTIISKGAEIALESEDGLIEFSNEIYEQCSEEGTNQERLEKMFGKEVIKAILDFNKRKAVEQDVLVMDKCIEEDMKATKIKLHLLITNSMNIKKPSSVKEIGEWGRLQIMVGGNMMETRTGHHCFVEDTFENFLHWFSQLDEVIIGSGSPQLESFTILEYNNMSEEERKEFIISKKLKW